MKTLLLSCHFILSLAFSVHGQDTIKEFKKDNHPDSTLFSPPREEVILHNALIIEKARQDTLFEYVDQYPEFPGSKDSLNNYLTSRIKYPALAKEHKIQGSVFLSMIVSSTGEISNVKVLKDIGGGCGQEAKRVAESMPNWKPGIMNGKPVAVRMSLRVLFRLEGN